MTQTVEFTNKIIAMHKMNTISILKPTLNLHIANATIDTMDNFIIIAL